jgi:hypothetical protein
MLFIICNSEILSHFFHPLETSAKKKLSQQKALENAFIQNHLNFKMKKATPFLKQTLLW